MSELINFPFKDQLFQLDIDHIPDINADMECVPTCIAAGLQWLTGKEKFNLALCYVWLAANVIAITVVILLSIYWAETAKSVGADTGIFFFDLIIGGGVLASSAISIEQIINNLKELFSLRNQIDKLKAQKRAAVGA